MTCRRVVPLAWVAGALACARPDDAHVSGAAADSGAARDAVGSVSGVWPSALGPALLVPFDAESLAVVVYPVGDDARRVVAQRVTLVGPSGDTVSARPEPGAPDSLTCGEAPLVRFPRATPISWSVGLVGSAAPIRTDSMDALSAADSSWYTSEMARLASGVTLPQPSRLAGLAFAMAAMRRLRSGGREIVAAELVRRLYQEATPAEERTIVVAERQRGGTAPFTLVHSDRSEGTEDTAAHFDLLSAIHVAGATLLILSRDDTAGTTFAVLERRAGGAWQTTWTRSIVC